MCKDAPGHDPVGGLPSQDGEAIAPLRGATKPRLDLVDDAPAYLYREHILSHYRVGGGYPSALLSLFELHNETGNAWTMLLGAAAATVLMNKALHMYADDGVPLQFFLLYVSVVVHTPFSTTLHLCIGVSEDARRVWRTLDVFFIQSNSILLGIALAIPVMTDTTALSIYSLAITGIFLRNVHSTMVMRRIWDIPKPKLVRDIRNMVLAYCAPLVVQLGKDLVAGENVLESAAFALGIPAVLAFGGHVYGKHVPEKWFPGWFDLLWNSHQIMHTAAFVAHCLEWLFLVRMSMR